MKSEIRPTYSELQGYLSQAPKLEGNVGRISDSVFWVQINRTIDELNKISGKNYDDFKLSPETMTGNGMRTHQYINISTYRMKLGGLIAKLHGEYFSDEVPPFSGMPATSISFTQHQNQTVQVQMLLEVQSKIDEKISQFPEGTQERTFLEKIKNSLSSVKNTVELIGLLLTTGNEIGLTISQVLSLFR